MTLNKLIFHSLKKYPNLNKFNLYELIFYFSKKISNKNELALNLQKEIDFNFKKFIKVLKIHCEKSKPISRIIGFENFEDIKIFLNKNVFAPRIETFNWVNKFANENKNIFFSNYLDICTGTGFISIIFKKKLKIKNCIGIDINSKAIKIAKKNAELNNVKINYFKKKIEDFINSKNYFDLITCNPPYISKKDTLVENSALFYDPKNSLFAKDNGLYFYNKIISNLDKILLKNGVIIFEIGFNQKNDILKILKKNSINKFDFLKDENNFWRTLIIIKE